MMGYYGSWGVMGFIGFLVVLLCMVGIVLLVVWGVQRLGPSAGSRPQRDEAIEVLKLRYAAGEISEADYQQALRTLGAAKGA